MGIFFNTKNKKEKEHALSLLRIPLNFFEEDNSKSNIRNNSNPDKVKTDESVNPPKKNQVELEYDPSTPNDLYISKELEVKDATSSPPTSKKVSTAQAEEAGSVPTEKKSSEESTENSHSEQPTPKESTKASKAEQASTAEENSEEKNSTNPPPVSPQQNSNTESQNTAGLEHQPQPTSNKAPDTNSSKGNIENPSHEKTPTYEPSHDDKKNNDTLSNGKKKPSSDNDKGNPSKDNKPKDSDGKKDKKAKELKDKFNKTPAGQKLNNAKDGLKNSVKNKMNDTLTKSPEAQKALGALKTANDVKDAVKDLDAEKMQEAVGDAAVKVAGKAGDAVVPGLGKAIEVTDAVVGQTKIAKKAKKAIGGCCCTVGCIIPLLIVLIPVIIMVQGYSWITDLFKRDKSIYGDFDEKDLARLEEASKLYSMQEYTDLTTNLNNPSFIENLLGISAQYPIQEALEEYMEQHYTFTQEEVDDIYDKYGDLIEDGYLMPIEAGDLTSFGTAFEMLLDNYIIRNLKAPCSAPQRVKTINGEKIVYTTYDPTGIHQPLFDDVLNNIELLKTRFNGQVDPAWFDELNDMLDKPFPVYLDGVDSRDCLDNPSSIPQRTLRELFIETSHQLYDTEYYTELIEVSFTKYSGANEAIIAEYKELNKRLAMLELMTYMLSYQKYYSQIEEFNREYNSSIYENKDMFDEKFFAQFLTFSNIEYYLALSNLADHSLTYEIAVASIEGSINNIEVCTLILGDKRYLGIEKFDNWFATFYLNPTIKEGEDGTLYYNMEPHMQKTQICQYLFDKYNVEADIFEDEERTKGQNQNSFFGAFELATGIKIAIEDDYGNEQTPIYYPNYNKVNEKLNSNVVSSNRSLPISNTNNVVVSAGYGQAYSRSTTSALNMPENKKHSGIDYAVTSGSTVLAASSGTAHVFRGNTGYGNYVRIDHDDGYSSYYAHGNGTFFIRDGAKVTAGQPIMQSGNSGNSTGPHLHFEVRNQLGSTINPTSYIYSV